VPEVSRPKKVAASRDVDGIIVPRDATEIEPGARCETLIARYTKLKAVPEDTEARIMMDFSGSKELTSLPARIKTGSLRVKQCQNLATLPADLDVVFLDASDCSQLTQLPENLKLQGGGLYLQGCSGLTALPDNMGEVTGLDLKGCSGITALPEGLTVTSWMDISGTGITELPPAYRQVGLRRRGSPVTFDQAIA